MKQLNDHYLALTNGEVRRLLQLMTIFDEIADQFADDLRFFDFMEKRQAVLKQKKRLGNMRTCILKHWRQKTEERYG